ncbi:MAG: S-methyl-5-thioribose-1-phosphate isomerase, partial [Nitrososphaerales archaeon]
IKVIATETRPALQGARLTCFELKSDRIPVTLIADSMVGYVMQKGLVDKVIVGADRITKLGHTFNKIGTYQIAVLAQKHNIPFYVAAPKSTFDINTKYEDVIIEERSLDEMVIINKKRIAPKGINVLNPAFDMTPPELITGIITEKGLLLPPFEESINNLFKNNS